MTNPANRSIRRGAAALRALLIAALLAVVAPARAAVDLTGSWTMHMTFPIVHDFPMTIAQSGTSLVMQIGSSWFAPGTIDLATNQFSAGTFPGTPLCDGDFVVNGVASPDGSFIDGSGFVEAGDDEACGPLPIEYTATRSRCGNGALDPGETCDDGNRTDGDCCSSECTRDPAGVPCMSDGHACTADVCDASGTCTHAVQSAGTVCRFAIDPICDLEEACDGTGLDCPANALAPPGTVCRPSANPCDPAEVCDPDFGFCPSEVPPVDEDHDGVADGCDPCPTTTPFADVRLRLASYDGNAGNDKVTLEAAIAIAPAAVAGLDPAATGVEILVARVSGATELRASLPPGAYDPVTRAGWRVSQSGTTWTWKSKDPDLAITKLRIRLRPGTPPTVEVKGGGKRLDFAADDAAMPQLSIALDPPARTTCGESHFFFGDPLGAHCYVRKGGKLLDCR